MWPYHFHRRRAQFKRSSALAVYSVVIHITVLGLLASSVYNFNSVAAHQAGSFNVYSYQMHAYLQMFALVTIFGTQHRYCPVLAELAEYWMSVMDDIRQQHAGESELGFWYALVLWTLKVIGMNGVQLVAVACNVASKGPSMMSSPLAVAAWILPSIMLMTVPDAAFGVLLMQHHFYRRLNERLRSVVTRLQRHFSGSGALVQRPFERMQMSCDLSDQLDELALLHDRITVFVQRLNRVVAWPLLMWSLSGIFMVVLRLYVQFLEVARIVDANDILDFRPVEFGLKLCSLAATFCGMVLFADTCSRLVNEVCRFVLIRWC